MNDSRELTYVQKVARSVGNLGFYERDNCVYLDFRGKKLRFTWDYGEIQDYSEGREQVVEGGGGSISTDANGYVSGQINPVTSYSILHKYFLLRRPDGSMEPYTFSDSQLPMGNGQILKPVRISHGGVSFRSGLVNCTLKRYVSEGITLDTLKAFRLFPSSMPGKWLFGVIAAFFAFIYFVQDPSSSVSGFIKRSLPRFSAPYNAFVEAVTDQYFFTRHLSLMNDRKIADGVYNALGWVHMRFLEAMLNVNQLFTAWIVGSIALYIAQNIWYGIKLRKMTATLDYKIDRLHRALL